MEQNRHPFRPGAATNEQASPSNLAASRALVPVQRHDGFTPKRRRKFLKVLRKTGCVADACRAVGISDTAVYKARRRDPSFRAQWKAARSKAGGDIELIAWQRAVDGVEEQVIAYGKVIGTRRKYDPQLFRMLLQASNPDRYGGQGFGSRKALEKKIRAEIAAEQEREQQHHPDTIEEVRRRILRKLKRVRENMVAAGEGYEDENGKFIPAGYVRDPNAAPPPPQADTPSSEPSGPLSEPHRPESEPNWPDPEPPRGSDGDDAPGEERPKPAGRRARVYRIRTLSRFRFPVSAQTSQTSPSRPDAASPAFGRASSARSRRRPADRPLCRPDRRGQAALTPSRPDAASPAFGRASSARSRRRPADRRLCLGSSTTPVAQAVPLAPPPASMAPPLRCPGISQPQGRKDHERQQREDPQLAHRHRDRQHRRLS